MSRSFDLFWDNIIAPTIKYCLKGTERYDGASNLKIDVDEDTFKKNLQNIYLRKREWLKREYLPEKDNASLDFHKLGALLCRSIVGCKPFSMDYEAAASQFNEHVKSHSSDYEVLKWQVDCIYINYKLAFFVASGVAYYDLLYNISKVINNGDESTKKKEVYKLFLRKMLEFKRLPEYEKSQCHDDFDSTMIVSLMKQDIKKRDFDYLSYGAILFQWQVYAKQRVVLQLINEGAISFLHNKDEIDSFLGSESKL